ncbi:AraC family transcriptional regulator [Amycolatopsis rhabdoformis]|uniref:AraC family transcriptional regulator n=1 Tax=Amycolatopsis rhabdoformis TaxID=1448059 RepID=A0ABZ1HYZ1_9PSEU|nr:AraC family transcriptional regulator [Amycolatopsis rhabdoformis]WSE27170.1 AraC family transcriptional regulator [Amycolatopsis rhabdoformis]
MAEPLTPHGFLDGVSRLIRLARLEGTVDVRCLISGRFSMEHEAVGPGTVPFYLVLHGHCTATTGSAAIDLAPGDLLVFSHGDAHQVRVADGRKRRYEDEPGPTFVTRRTVGGGTPELDLFCGHYRFDSAAGVLLFRLLPPLVHVTLDDAAVRLADVLREEAGFDGSGTGVIVSSLCEALLAMALRSRPEQRLDTPALWTAMGDDVLGRVLAEVVDRPGEAWTIERMATAASMSRATFLRRFSTRTGTTVATLLTTIRMMIAADLLTSSAESVSHIARQVGYSSESAFAQTFRAAVGEPPARFRKKSVARD